MTEDLQQYQLSLIVEEESLPFFENVLESFSPTIMFSLIENGKDAGKWKLQAIFDSYPNIQQLKIELSIAFHAMEEEEPLWELEVLPKKNWLKENLSMFPPILLGRYYIYGSHIHNPNILESQIPLQIDAATAFGSGEHATTQGCLQAFEDIVDLIRPRKILDMGCGSCILSMAAAKVLPEVQIDAVDIDEESVRVSRENIRINRVDKQINVFQSEGYQKVKLQYDLVFSNILAKPLIDMASDLYAHLSKGGVAILSGFLNEQKDWVVQAHEKAGFTCLKTYAIKEWGTAIVKRN